MSNKPKEFKRHTLLELCQKNGLSHFDVTGNATDAFRQLCMHLQSGKSQATVMVVMAVEWLRTEHPDTFGEYLEIINRALDSNHDEPGKPESSQN